MIYKTQSKIKSLTFSLSDGYIGKPVSLTPTFLGCFILNQYLSKSQIPHIEPLLANEVMEAV